MFTKAPGRGFADGLSFFVLDRINIRKQENKISHYVCHPSTIRLIYVILSFPGSSPFILRINASFESHKKKAELYFSL